MINGFNAIPYQWARLLHIGLDTEVEISCYQIHFYGCRKNNSNMSSPVRKHRRVDISAVQKRDIRQLIPLNRPLCVFFYSGHLLS